MKISTNTINVLKNFSKINPSIIVAEEHHLKTISPSKTIMANAVVDTDFYQRFAIYNLDRFISTMSLYNDPDLTFSERYVDIKGGSSTTRYTYAEESTIAKTPDREIKLPSADVSVRVLNDNIRDVEKAAGVLGLPEIVVRGKDGKVFLEASDCKNPSGDVYAIEVGESDKVFNAIFKLENIKILPGDYDVTISSRGISKFEGVNFPYAIEYFIAVENSSTF